MNKILLAVALLGLLHGIVNGQGNVGIGTNTPHNSAILDLTSTSKVFLPPRMDKNQVNAITLPPYGSMVYNQTIHSHMSYTRLGSKPNPSIPFLNTSNNKWLPVSPGPKVLAWGFVDSSGGNENTVTSASAPIIVGSGNFSVTWQGKSSSKKWYELSLYNDNFDQDSMLLIVTPVGNGSWDVAVALGEIIAGEDVNATIKFTDISRSVSGWPEIDRRRRSKFNFILYDLRGY
jgi:hypothetical protein